MTGGAGTGGTTGSAQIISTTGGVGSAQIVSIPSQSSSVGGGSGVATVSQAATAGAAPSNQTPTTTTTTIRKVGSSSNLSSLQQKVQVVGRSGANIQIVQSGNAQRLGNQAAGSGANTKSISTTQLPSGSVQQQQQQQQQSSKSANQNS